MSLTAETLDIKKFTTDELFREIEARLEIIEFPVEHIKNIHHIFLQYKHIIDLTEKAS